jgi:hypothetical protein
MSKYNKGGGNNTKNVKHDSNVEGDKKGKRKVKFPYKICKYDHVTHQFPKMKEAHLLLM